MPFAEMPAVNRGITCPILRIDSKTLRVIAEAEGAINVTVTTLPGL
jgi:hypothetical protein